MSYALSITQTLNWMVRMTSEVETNVVGASFGFLRLYDVICVFDMCMCIYVRGMSDRMNVRPRAFHPTNPTQTPTQSHTPFFLTPTAVERIKEYSEVPSEAPAIVEGKRPPAHWPQQGRIQITDLCLAYRPGLPLVLRNLTLDIKAGERVGIVGRCVFWGGW